MGHPLHPKFPIGLSEKGGLNDPAESFKPEYRVSAEEVFEGVGVLASRGVCGLQESVAAVAVAGDVDGFALSCCGDTVLVLCGEAEADLRLEARLLDLRSSAGSVEPLGGLAESLLRVNTFISYGLKASFDSGDFVSGVLCDL